MSNPMFKGGFGSCGLYHITNNPKGECSYCMVAQLQEENRFRERQQKRCQARLKELLEENKKLHLDTRVNDMGMEIGNLKRTIESHEAVIAAAKRLPITRQLEHRSGIGYEINHSHDIYYQCDLCRLVGAIALLEKS